MITRHTKLGLLYLSTTLFLSSCGGKGSGNGPENAAVPVVSIDEIVGVWQLTSIFVKEAPDEAIVVSGSHSIRIRKDGVSFSERVAFGLSVGGEDIYSVCSSYSSLKLSLTSGNLILTDRVFANLSGKCGEDTATPTAYKDEDSALKAYKNGESLQIESENSMLVDGVSKKITIVQSFKKISDETWDASGLDPGFIGTFNARKIFVDYACTDTPESASRSEIAFSGNVSIQIAASSYTETYTSFKIGTGDPCTATTSGTLSPSPLTLSLTQTSSTDACAASSNDSQDVVLAERDIIGIGNKWVTIAIKTKADTDCAGGRATERLIGISEKQ